MTAYEDVLAYGYRKARAMGMSHHDAEDASQVAAFRVSQREHTFDSSRDAWPLIQVIVRQSVHEHVRSVYADRATPVPTEERFDQTPAGPFVSPPMPELSERMVAALATLSPRQREILLEFADTDPSDSDGPRGDYVGNISTAAARLGVSGTAVRKALQLAVPKMRGALEGA